MCILSSSVHAVVVFLNGIVRIVWWWNFPVSLKEAVGSTAHGAKALECPLDWTSEWFGECGSDWQYRLFIDHQVKEAIPLIGHFHETVVLSSHSVL